MAKSVARKIPHNVKERYRHQHIQRLLENVASHVPRIPALKKETKAKKLRRSVLFVRFLLHKHAELSKESTTLEDSTPIYSFPKISDSKEEEQRKDDSCKVCPKNTKS